jgi:hypothetical protein
LMRVMDGPTSVLNCIRRALGDMAVLGILLSEDTAQTGSAWDFVVPQQN